jgi:hypothetical protein
MSRFPLHGLPFPVSFFTQATPRAGAKGSFLFAIIVYQVQEFNREYPNFAKEKPLEETGGCGFTEGSLKGLGGMLADDFFPSLFHLGAGMIIISQCA